MSSAQSYALRLINRRLRSAWEVDQALLRKGVESDERLAVIAKLEEVGLIDDRRFALAWVHTRDRLAPRGEVVLRQELREKHIADEIIGEVLRERRSEAADESGDQPTEDDLARAVIQTKQGAYAHLPKDVRARRLTALLLRRGFSYEVARRILEA